ncbi:MAG: hypothetical protein H6825_06505 [Planctomycetes bacterium]|nr:hypothetical protein [Planctomycetota bacterium]
MKGLVRWWNGMPVAGRSVVTLLLLGVIFAGVGFGVDLMSGAIVTGILLGAIVLFLLVRWLVMSLERRRGQGLSARLWSRMSSGGGGGLDATSEELSVRQEMQRRWKDVHDTLKERRYDYYSFPWYLILGAAQSGKTTTIQQSNQEFPIGAEPVIDYGGTKGCNWFFTNKAILIDTAGRYVEHLGEDDADWDTMLKRDQEEWETFLKLLKEERGRSPVNGVIVTVKLEDLLEQDPRRQKKIQDALRKALIHIEEQLEIRVPVYVLVTMMDLLVGFVDFFSNLPGLSDRSLFGWSRGGAFDKPFEPKEFEPAFGKLADRLDELLLEFLEARAGRGDVREDSARLDRMLAFPDEFRGLGAPLTALLEQLFKKSSYNEQHFFRGVYFTSGRQEGRPVMNACQSLLGDGAGVLEEEDVAVSSGGGNKAFFIADLYEDKVFHEAGLVRMTKRASFAQRLKKRAYLGVAAVLAVAAGLWVANEISRFPTLDFDAGALTRLGERPFTRADIEVGAPALFGPEGMQGVARYLGRLESKEFRDASVLASSSIDETSASLLAAYRKLYAEKVFATLLGDFLAEQSSHSVDDWARCAALSEVLVTLRDLARDDDEVTVDVLRTRLLPSIRNLQLAVAGESSDHVAYDEVISLAGSLGEADARAPLDDLRDVVRSRQPEVLDLLNSRVVAFWTSWLDALRDPLDPLAGRAPQVEGVDAAWWWLRLRGLDTASAQELEGLTRVLREVSVGARDGSTFARECVVPWTAAFGRLSSLQAALEAHLSGSTPPKVTPGHAFDALEQVFEPLLAVARQGDPTQGEIALADAIRAVGTRLQSEGAELDAWSNRQSSAERVVTFAKQPRGANAIASAADAVGDALDADPVGWTFTNPLSGTTWRRLRQVDDLVAHDTQHDPILDPGKSEFWTLRDPKALTAWLEGPEALSVPELGGVLRELVDAANDAKVVSELRRQRRTGLFGGFAVLAIDDARRHALLEKIDVTRLGRTLTGSFAPELYGHRANSDVARALADVCSTLRASADTATRDLVDSLYLQYLAEVFVPFWRGGLVDVMRGLGRAPDAPPDDFAALRAWRAALPKAAADLEAAAVLATFAGAQSGDLDAAVGTIPKARESLAPALALWERYRPAAGRTDDEDVERVRRMASALAGGLADLANRPEEVAPYDVLADCRPGTPLYKALIEPSQVQDALRQGGAASDPIVGLLVDTAAPVRRALGHLASKLFADDWAALGPAQAGPGAALLDRFPFTSRTPGTSWTQDTLVDRPEAARFFDHERFRELAETVAPHLQPVGPGSPSLYTIDFPEPATTHRDVFRRCVELRDLCGFGPGGQGDELRVPVELYDSRDTQDNKMPTDWTTRWTFDLSQKMPRDNVSLALPFWPSPRVGDKAPLWTPSRPGRVQIKDARPEATSGTVPWVFVPPFTSTDAGGHWTDLLLFVYANPRATPSEVDNPQDGPQKRQDIRWIRVTFKRGNGTSVNTPGSSVTKIFGVRMDGMPDELPDLRSVWTQR